MRYRPDGTFAWERAAGLVTGQAYQVLMTLVDSSVPGEIVIAGSHMEALFYPHLQLQSFGLGGGRQFSIPSVAEPNSPDLIVTGLERGPSGEIFVMGPKDVVGTVAAYAGVHCYDASGAQLWARHLGNLGFHNAPQDVVASPSGETTILSNAMLEFVEPFDMVLTRVDSAGTQIFERRYSPNPGGVVTGRALELLPGGGFVVAGSIQRTMVSSERSFALMYFDANGQETGVAYLPGVAPETPGEAEHITMDRDGNLVVLGWSEDPSDEGVLASFDPMGNPRWVRRIAGTRPLSSLTSSTSSALAYDVNGNALSLTQVVKSGVAPNQDLALRLIKTMRGGDVGTSFCGPAVPNSTGVPAELRVLGLDDVTENNVALVATDLPGGTATLLLASQAASSVPGAGGGQGTLCLGGSIGRYVGPGQVRRASANGDASLQVDLDAVPQPTGLAQATAGQTWRFQAWYRDANPGTTSNMTNGVAVLLQ